MEDFELESPSIRIDPQKVKAPPIKSNYSLKGNDDLLPSTRKIPFTKYAGCGNDFIIIDNRMPVFLENDYGIIASLCHRRTGVGADGIILLGNSQCADFRMRIFNADGSEAEMCGNGVRCLIKFSRELGICLPQYRIETMHRLITAVFVGDEVAVEMGNPEDLRWNVPVTIGDEIYNVHHIDTGVPHLILFDPKSQSFPLDRLGQPFRSHPLFAPKGANFNVASITLDGEIYNRTYERGVEEETLACGTGCTAVAIAAAVMHGLPSPIKVHSLAGILEISFDIENGKPSKVSMKGPATKIFTGVIER